MSRILHFCTHWKQFSILSIALLSLCFTQAQNPIVAENDLPGNPVSEWGISGAGDLTIQGFATDISVNKGQTVHFKIKTDAAGYNIDIYRLGYYGGMGARFMGTGTITATLPQTQPSPITDAVTGIVDCGNWSESATWDVPSTAVSGIYIAKLTSLDNGGTSHITFIVRDDASNSDLFFKTSDATWQAYNVYGGNSLYVGTTALPSGHASKVSYNRPFISRNGGGGGGAGQDWLFNAEYPMIRFLERNGYDVTYTTDIDIVRAGNLILNHKVFLSVGHDEYWSGEQRTNVEAARNAGVHLAFFSGNEVYWKTRWENSVDGTGTPYRTLVCYKEGTLGENVCGAKCDPTTEWTGLWRDGCAYSSDGCRPENALTGQIGWRNSTGSIEVPASYRNLRFWRNTSIETLSAEDIAILPAGTLGNEWDFEQYPDSYPSGRITLSNTTLSGKTHKLSLYRHSSGALVFGAGTIQWAWGLDDFHDNGSLPASPDMQQATVNLFADMGVQPEKLQSGLTPAAQSDDIQAPISIITSTINNASFPSFAPISVTGTTSDGKVVVGVEYSIDGGLTWKPVNGTTNWNFSWTPTTQGPVTIKIRGFDDSGNMEAAGTVPASNAITINITAPECPCTIYQLSDTAALTNSFDNATGIELGVKFRSIIDGYITGLRFYKSSNDMGIHKGSLWTLGGMLLAQATFINESASGWQEVLFDAPVAITANTTYVASYNSPTGYYAVTNPYFTTDHVNGPLTAIAKTDPDGPNGVYTYSPTSVFPALNSQSENYWVDIVFNTSNADVIAPKVVAATPANNTIGMSINPTLTVTFNEALNPSTINEYSIELMDPTNAPVPVTFNYDYGLHKVTVTPVSPLDYSSPYTLTVKTGEFAVQDIAGNVLTAESSQTFTTIDALPLGPNEGPGGPILVISNSANPFSLYAAEILRAEGLNEFATMDITTVTPTILNNYDVVVLGEMTVVASQVTMLTNWVNAGGTLIAFRPSLLLNPLMGISNPSGTLSDKYLLVNTASGPGVGIVNQTIQFHGTANLHTLSGATSLATLYSDANTATTNPAVSTINVGVNGGKAIAFTYDLAKSIIYTRQGNPAWAGTERDALGPIRSDDLFFGLPANSGADWIDFNKVAIPQADEQQRLLANIIIQNNLHRKPLPRFWYLPRALKAAIVMTGDDHSNNGTVGRFNQYLTLGPNTPTDVANWTAIRGTSYIYPGTPITNAQIVSFQNQGFEIAVHPVTGSGCVNFTPTSLENDFTTYLGSFAANFPGAAAPVTNRTHCLVWSDWATHPKTEYNHGIRLDANYYYWPGTWLQNRPGMFTGSGMPMRFADLNGTMIDVYQATTQMTDESGINVADFCNAVLDKATGSEGYYGVFTANMHTDTANHTGSNAIIASALAHQVPVVSAKQMLTWIDGRNNSSFSSITWAGNVLSFTVTAASGSTNLRAMLPFNSGSGVLTQISRTGSAIGFTTSTIKGMQYAFFDASVTGNYTAVYAPTTTITGQVTLQGRPAAPNAQWQVPVTIELYVTGNPVPVETFTTTTNTSGQFTISGVPVGTYNIGIKNPHTLRRVKLDQTLVAGGNNINFGTLLEGDVNNDNFVSLTDLSSLISSFNKTTGDPGYDPRADLNNDVFVSLTDLSLLISNFNTAGENNP